MTASPGRLRTQILNDRDEFARRAAEWDAIAAGAASPFLMSAWSRAWWEASDLPVRCMLQVDDDDRLRAGVLYSRGRLGVRGAADLHSGDWGVVAADETASAQAWRRLAAEAGPVGRLRLPALNQSAAAEARAVLSQHGHRVVTAGRLDSPALVLPERFDALLSRISRNLRQQVGRARRALERDGKLVVRTTSGGPHLESNLESFLRLEASGWKGRAGTAVLSTPRTERLYRRFAELAAEDGTLRLSVLELDGVPLAADLSCRVGSRMSLVKTGYDEAHAHLSPGLVLRAEAFRAAIDEGCVEFDLLGAPAPYKMRWGAELRPRATLLALRGPSRGEAFAREHLRPIMARVKRHVSARSPWPRSSPAHRLPGAAD